MNRRRLTAWGLLGVLLMGLPVGAQGGRRERLKEEQAQTQAQIAQTRQTLAAVQRQAAATLAQIHRLDQQLVAQQAVVAERRRQVVLARQAVQRQRLRVARVRRTLQQDMRLLDKLLVLEEEQGPVQALAVLLGAASFSDFLTRLSYLVQLGQYEAAVVHRTQTEEVRLAQALRVLVADEQAVRAAAAEAAAQERLLAQEAAQRQQVFAQLENQGATLAAILLSLERRSRALALALTELQVEVSRTNLTDGQLTLLVDSVARAYGLDPELVFAVIRQESGGNPHAVSRAGAEGLMQLMPSTAAELGVTNPFNPAQNIRAGVAYLARMLRKFHGDLALALAAYNAGPGTVEAYGGIPPFPETRAYVANILAALGHTP